MFSFTRELASRFFLMFQPLELFDLLELNKGELVLFSLERAIEHPREFTSKDP